MIIISIKTKINHLENYFEMLVLYIVESHKYIPYKYSLDFTTVEETRIMSERDTEMRGKGRLFVVLASSSSS